MGNGQRKYNYVAGEYSDWMASLPESLHNTPLNQIAIPGSHDSTTFYLNMNEPVSCDETDKRLLWLGNFCLTKSITRCIVRKWGKTQSLNYTQQLEAGIRYFDVRVAMAMGSFYLLHGLYSHTLEEMIKDINQYLENHTKEIVLLDLNHFYQMSNDDHEKCQKLLKQVFGDKLCPYKDNEGKTMNMADITLSNLWQHGWQVIVFYQYAFPQGNELFWPKEMIPSPYSKTVHTTRELRAFLNGNLSNSHSNRFYVTQGVLNPDWKYALCHCYCSLEGLDQHCAEWFVQWLSDKHAGVNGINVCIMDFVELQDYIPTVVNLNYKMADAQ